VQIGEGQVYPDRLQIERVFKAVGGSEQPAAETLAGVQLGPHAFRGDQQVLGDRLDGAVMLEFAHAVVEFRGGRENFDNQVGIEQRVPRFIQELRFAAHGGEIRVGVHGCGVQTNTHVVHVCPAGTLAELHADYTGQI